MLTKHVHDTDNGIMIRKNKITNLVGGRKNILISISVVLRMNFGFQRLGSALRNVKFVSRRNCTTTHI